MRAQSILAMSVAVLLAGACGSSGSGGNGTGNGSSSGGSSGSSSGSSGGSSSGGGSGGSSGSSGGSSSGGGSGGSSGGSGSSSGGTTDGGGCGTCPTGFTCNASGTYCVNPHGVPAFDHVFLIMMENTSLSDIQGSSSAPFLNGLLTTQAYAANYTTSTHPSLPNYITVTSGSSQGIGCDCAVTGQGSSCNALTCNLILGSCDCPVTGATHLGQQLDTAGLGWREYGESMGTPCTPNAPIPFASKHVPFLYYADIFGSTTECADRVRDYADFPGDMAAGTKRFMMISPNLCDDMHGDPSCANQSFLAAGDTWLSTNVNGIMSSSGMQPGGKDVLFIVWDEQTSDLTPAPMPLFIVGPLVKPGMTPTAYGHPSLLATIEDGLGLPRLSTTTSTAPINDVWK